MQIIKRDGRQEPAYFDKIAARLKRLTYGLSNKHCDTVLLARKVFAGLHDGVTTVQVDLLAAKTAAAMAADHPDYALLAGRLSISNLHKSTKKSFSETIKILYNYHDKKSGKEAALISDDVYKTTMMVSSCFLPYTKNHSIERIYHTLKDCAVMSISSGRTAGSHTHGTDEASSVIPMLSVQ